METTQSGQQTENQMKKKHESNIRDLWDNIGQSTHKRDSRRKIKQKRGIENIFEEIMAENFPNLKNTDIKIQEAQRAPHKLNPNRPTPRHIIIKMSKVKDKKRILKEAREK